MIKAPHCRFNVKYTIASLRKMKTSCVFRDREGSLESLVLRVQLVLKVPEGRVVSWASQDPRETRETLVHLDHL